MPDIDFDYADDNEKNAPKPKAKSEPKKPSFTIPRSSAVPITSKPMTPFTRLAPASPASSVQAKPKVDVTDIKKSSAVKHKTFGNGAVTKLEKDKIWVAFSKTEKMFMFPIAFEQGFLRK